MLNHLIQGVNYCYEISDTFTRNFIVFVKIPYQSYCLTGWCTPSSHTLHKIVSTSFLIGKVKDKIFAGTPISGHFLPGTQVDFELVKILSRQNWLRQNLAPKLTGTSVLVKQNQLEQDFKEKKSSGTTIWAKFSAGTKFD